jgi:hypothetical protein
MKKIRRPSVKLFRILIIPVLISSSLAQAKDETATSPTNYEMVEAPTAYTLMHGGYDLLTRMYENGGLYVQGDVGFEDFFMFGFSGNATNVVGQGTIQIQTPGIGLKFKVLDERTAPVALAVGWDNRGYGTQTNGVFFPGTQKGFYGVVSHEFKEAGYLQVHAGANVVTLDNYDANEDLGAFFGTSFAVAQPLMFNLEMDKLLSSYWQFNANVMFNVDNPLRVGMDFRDINRGDLFSRIVRVQYMGFF